VPPLFESTRYDVSPVANDDLGRYEVTGAETDRGRFRVPSLRNLRETGPYFHDGSVETLAEAVLLEIELRVAQAEMSDADLEALLSFLTKSLMDKSRAPARPYELPSGLPVPIDDYRVPR
jgi:cytochrome c peroxidase